MNEQNKTANRTITIKSIICDGSVNGKKHQDNNNNIQKPLETYL